jgi:hypothetical protein
MNRVKRRLLGIAVLGLSLIVSAAVFGAFFYQSRLPAKSIKVTGVATKRIGSDIVKWRVTITRNTGVADLTQGYSHIKGDLDTFTQLLTSSGINRKDITVQPVNTNPVFGQNGQGIIGYQIMQGVYLASSDLGKVESIALNPSILAEKGIMLQGSSLEYYSSKLSEIKRDLLAEATKDAQGRAEVIARSSGDKISSIESAKVGVFQITEPYSTEVSDYGIYNTATREKDISVTMNVSFTLK